MSVSVLFKLRFLVARRGILSTFSTNFLFLLRLSSVDRQILFSIVSRKRAKFARCICGRRRCRCVWTWKTNFNEIRLRFVSSFERLFPSSKVLLLLSSLTSPRWTVNVEKLFCSVLSLIFLFSFLYFNFIFSSRLFSSLLSSLFFFFFVYVRSSFKFFTKKHTLYLDN